jgi:hypothetical protein
MGSAHDDVHKILIGWLKILSLLLLPPPISVSFECGESGYNDAEPAAEVQFYAHSIAENPSHPNPHMHP